MCSKRKIWGAEDPDGSEWYRKDEWERVTGAKEKELDRHYDIFMEEPEGFVRVDYAEVWEFVTACFTEQGCKEYLAVNGHNLSEPRIYVQGGYRNAAEWAAIRKMLAIRHRVCKPSPVRE